MRSARAVRREAEWLAGLCSPRQIAVSDSYAVLSASLFVDSACRHRKIRLDDGRGGGVSIEPSSEKLS